MATSPAPTPNTPRFAWLRWLGGGVIAFIVLIQFSIFWLPQTNPPVLSGPTWPNAEAEAIARKACYDCHSNETVWPFYSKIAPVSWLVTRDVVEGRSRLNFSEWQQGGGEEGSDLAKMVANGKMPMPIYTITHPEARLTGHERVVLVEALTKLGVTVPSSSVATTKTMVVTQTITSELAATTARNYRGSGEVTQVELKRKGEHLFFAVRFTDGAEVFVNGLTGQVAYARLQSRPQNN